MNPKLDGKVAIVTGGARGIGRAVTLALVNENADVAIVSNTSIELARNLAGEISRTGRRALAIKADVTKSDEVDRAVEETSRCLGRIDILVNNAGIVRVGPVIDFGEEDWDATLDVNAKGVFLFSKAVAKYMTSQRKGKIVNIASDSGKTGEPLFAAYSASKFAVVGFTQAFALEMAPYNINVNAVCPCYVETEMLEYTAKIFSALESVSLDEIKRRRLTEIPLGRMAAPEDIARAVVFLASDDSAFITGQSINVTGGGAKKFCVGE